MSDHWNAVIEFWILYKMVWKLVIAALCFWDKQLCIIQATNDENTLTVQSIFQMPWEESRDMLLSSSLSTLNSLLWSGPDTNINTCDPVQNLGQGWIFYKLGQIHLIQKKMIQMTWPGFNPDMHTCTLVLTNTHAHLCSQTHIHTHAYIHITICDCLSENPPSSHLLVFWEIPF